MLIFWNNPQDLQPHWEMSGTGPRGFFIELIWVERLRAGA